MALNKPGRKKRKLVESDTAPPKPAKRIQAPDDSVARNFKSQEHIQDASGPGSPIPRRKKRIKESPLKVLRNGKAIGAVGGGRGRGPASDGEERSRRSSGCVEGGSR